MALKAGVITIYLDSAKDLKGSSIRQDPYCVLRVGTQTFRTNTALDAGRNPVWKQAFQAVLTNEDDVLLDIEDANLLEDGHIGRAAFSLARARECGSDQIQVPVVSRTSGRQHGVLAVALRWEPLTASALATRSDMRAQRIQRRQALRLARIAALGNRRLERAPLLLPLFMVRRLLAGARSALLPRPAVYVVTQPLQQPAAYYCTQDVKYCPAHHAYPRPMVAEGIPVDDKQR